MTKPRLAQPRFMHCAPRVPLWSIVPEASQIGGRKQSRKHVEYFLCAARGFDPLVDQERLHASCQRVVATNWFGAVVRVQASTGGNGYSSKQRVPNLGEMSPASPAICRSGVRRKSQFAERLDRGTGARNGRRTWCCGQVAWCFTRSRKTWPSVCGGARVLPHEERSVQHRLVSRTGQQNRLTGRRRAPDSTASVSHGPVSWATGSERRSSGARTLFPRTMRSLAGCGCRAKTGPGW